jgi:hypothetical protein
VTRVLATAVLMMPLVLGTTSLSAQGLMQPATRENGDRRGQDRPHRLVVDLSTLGGYDRSEPKPPGEHVVTDSLMRPSGYLGTANVGGRYRVSSGRRSLSVAGAGYGSVYRYDGIAFGTPAVSLYGGDVNASASSGLGLRTDLSISQSLRVAPFAPLGLFGGLPAVAVAGTNPDDNLAVAAINSRSLTMGTAASSTHQWARGTNSTLSYSFNRALYDEALLVDSVGHAGSFSLQQSLGRAAGVRAAYRISRDDNNRGGLHVQNVVHRIDGGFTLTEKLSPTRTLALGVGLGASRVDSRDTVRQRYWSPTFYANARVDVGRTWIVGVDYRQSANTLPSPVFNANTFFGPAFLASANGSIASRLQLSLTTGYSRGKLPTEGPDAGVYEAITSTAQLSVPLSRSLSAMMAYSRFDTTLSAPVSFLGAGRLLDRSSIRAGFTWSLPLLRARMARGK